MFIIRYFLIFCHLVYDQIKVTFQMAHGAWHLAKMPKPIVTIFGSSKLPQHDIYARQAHKLAQLLTKENISVLTGGGPGIMQAANCGAIKTEQLRNLGIGVEGIDNGANMCVQHYVNTKYFYARKWLLMRYSSAFIVFPGGFGTLDEVTEIATLMLTKKLARSPIILIGKEYWSPLIHWLKDFVLKHGMIDADDLKLFEVVDDLLQVINLTCSHCLSFKQAQED